MEDFQGINTSALRVGVDDKQVYWSDGFFPGRDAQHAHAAGRWPGDLHGHWRLTIVCFFFYNIGCVAYMVVFLSDGSAVQVDTAAFIITTILPAGIYHVAFVTSIGVSQWGSQYLIIVASQTNGYWLWNGSALFGVVALCLQSSLSPM